MLLVLPRPVGFFRCIGALLGLVLFAFPVHAAQEWHVSGKGDDDRDGRSAATAFRSLSRVAPLVEPGDTVLIGDGIYTDESRPGSAVLTIATSGKPDAWITWKAAPNQRPEIRPHGWAGILVTGSYHVIEGLAVIGNNDALTLNDAIADTKKSPADPRFNTNGIFINGRVKTPDTKPHHVIVRGCTVAKNPGGGITAIETDHIVIEDNLVFENGWFMRYAGSGVTFLSNWQHDDAPGYHVVIRRNKVWDNKTLVPWEKTGKLSDGNGILLDVTDHDGDGATNPNADAAVGKPEADAAKPASKLPNPRPRWTARALIENNLSAFNGGSGIHTFRTRHVDIVNNTTYWNGQTVGYPELFANRSTDVVMLNNIIVPRPGWKVTSNNKNQDIRWDYNLYPISQDESSPSRDIVAGANDLVADPLFLKVARDLREADFRPRKNSPAVDSGTAELAPNHDLERRRRPGGRAIDRGAYEPSHYSVK